MRFIKVSLRTDRQDELPGVLTGPDTRVPVRSLILRNWGHAAKNAEDFMGRVLGIGL